MRRFAFVVAVLGMLVLVFLLIGDPEEILDYGDLEDLEVNERIVVSGKVESERFIFRGSKLLILEEGIEVICECVGDYEGKEIVVEGIVSEFEGEKQVSALKITTLIV